VPVVVGSFFVVFFFSWKSSMPCGPVVEVGEEPPETYHRRPLPEPAIALSSSAGLGLFREALAGETMGTYFVLAEQFHTQAEPSFCGLASLVMVLNGLAVDPKRRWKGPWRWYAESLLECCEPLEVVKERGVTLEKLACTASCNGLDVDVVRGPSVEELRATVSRVCAQRPDDVAEVLVASYSREALRQTGDGHFSPVGGYHRPSDSVLILDTARFKYPPHWVPLADLASAMARKDGPKPRGFLALRRQRITTKSPPIFQLRFSSFSSRAEGSPTSSLREAIITTTAREKEKSAAAALEKEEKDIVEDALARLEELVALGVVPGAGYFDAGDWCCETEPPLVDVERELREAARRLSILRDPHSSSSLSVVTLLAVPRDFWPVLLSDRRDDVDGLIHALDSALPSEPLSGHILDLRAKMGTYLGFELAEDDVVV